MDSQRQRSNTAPYSRAMYALVAKTAPGDESLWLPLTYHLLDTAAVMDYLLENWLPEHSCESLGLEQEDFRRLAFAAALLHDTGKTTKLFQCNITAQRPELRERLRDFGLEDGNFLTLKNLPHAAAGAELLRHEGFNESLAAVVGAHHGKPETGYGGEEYYFSESNPLSFGWLSRGGRATGWGAVQNEIIRWALSQDGMETPENLPECSMAAQMLLTALVIMADWIASNTAYFPLISTEELPHGQSELNGEFLSLEEGAVELAQEEAESDTLTVHSFFRGRKTRLLANLVVGTVDQLLMAALKRKHVMLWHLGLTGKVVIIDECHAYDAYMNTYLDSAERLDTAGSGRY